MAAEWTTGTVPGTPSFGSTNSHIGNLIFGTKTKTDLIDNRGKTFHQYPTKPMTLAYLNPTTQRA